MKCIFLYLKTNKQSTLFMVIKYIMINIIGALT